MNGFLVKGKERHARYNQDGPNGFIPAKQRERDEIIMVLLDVLLPKLGYGNDGFSFHSQSNHFDLTRKELFRQILFASENSFTDEFYLATDIKSGVGDAGTAIQQTKYIAGEFFAFRAIELSDFGIESAKFCIAASNNSVDLAFGFLQKIKFMIKLFEAIFQMLLKNMHLFKFCTEGFLNLAADTTHEDQRC